MQLRSYRKTEAGYRLKRIAEVDAPVVTIRVLRGYSPADRRLEAQRAMFLRQKREADEAIRRANEAARKFNGTGKSFDDIMRLICRAMKVRKIDIMSDRRTKNVVLARQAVCYWAKRLTTLSLPAIGLRLGRDHTTVLHAIRVYPLKRAQMGRFLAEAR